MSLGWRGGSERTGICLVQLRKPKSQDTQGKSEHNWFIPRQLFSKSLKQWNHFFFPTIIPIFKTLEKTTTNQNRLGGSRVGVRDHQFGLPLILSKHRLWCTGSDIPMWAQEEQFRGALEDSKTQDSSPHYLSFYFLLFPNFQISLFKKAYSISHCL